MKKLVILVILLIIALVLAGYFAFNKEAPATFQGPTGEPFVNGPSGPPPGSY